MFVKWCIKKLNKARNFDTLWRLQYSVSLQWDSLREKICGVSSRYLTVEDEEVNTTRFTLLAFEQEFSTFRVPLIHGSIKVSCKISQAQTKISTYRKRNPEKVYLHKRNPERVKNSQFTSFFFFLKSLTAKDMIYKIIIFWPKHGSDKPRCMGLAWMSGPGTWI